LSVTKFTINISAFKSYERTLQIFLKLSKYFSFQVENGVGKLVHVIHVNIYQVHHQTPLSLVVVPICSCLFAIVAVGSGIFVWLAFKRNLAVETADFDFRYNHKHLINKLKD